MQSSINKTERKNNETPLNIQRLETSLDPSKEEERRTKRNEAIHSYNERFGSIDLERSFMPLFELFWYSQLPCSDVRGLTSEAKDELSFIKNCYWKEKQINCNAVFQKRPTNRGMCCSFNMEKAENILKDSKYKTAISKQQFKDSEHGFKDNKIVDDNTQWFITNDEPKSKSGIHKGLTLVVDAHSDRLSSASVSDNFHGFPIIVEDSQNFPMIGFSGKRARPGFENNIEVNALRLHALDEIRKHDPDQRKCYFPDEYELRMHRLYSRSSCIFECELEFAAKCLTTCDEFGQICDCKDHKFINGLDLKADNGCIPWYYPLQDTDIGKFCDPWKTEKFQQILKDQVPEGLCNNCLPDCSITEFETSMTSAKLPKCDGAKTGSVGLLCNFLNGELNPQPWLNMVQVEYQRSNQTIPWYLDTVSSNKRINSTRFSDKRVRIQEEGSAILDMEKNLVYNAYDEDIGIINVFFAKKEVSKFVTKNTMSSFDFMYQVGGSLGFVMGLSMISLIEIGYWLFFGLLRSLVKLVYRKCEMFIRLC